MPKGAVVNVLKARQVKVPGSPPGISGHRKCKKPGRTRRPIAIKYGIKIPRDVKEAKIFDEEAGNTLWADAIRLKLILS